MDAVALVGRLLVSLSVVLGLMWLIARRLNKGGRIKNNRLIDVLSRQQLSRTASVAVVRVMDQALILGITDGQVSVIGETDLAAVESRLEVATPVRLAKRPSKKPARKPTNKPVRTNQVVARTAASADGATTDIELPRKALAGSALSPDTWRQTLESLRDLTARTK
jgi:flagellar protein FliO/FliZ